MIALVALWFASCGALAAQAAPSGPYPGVGADSARYTWRGAAPGSPLPRSGYTAEVRCEAGLPVPHYADDSTAHYDLARAETVKHETKHVAQLMGGCDSILAQWHRDPAARLDAEVEAACTGLEAYTDSTRRAQRETQTIATLGMLYPAQMTSGALFRAFTVWCHGGEAR